MFYLAASDNIAVECARYIEITRFKITQSMFWIFSPHNQNPLMKRAQNTTSGPSNTSLNFLNDIFITSKNGTRLLTIYGSFWKMLN